MVGPWGMGGEYCNRGWIGAEFLGGLAEAEYAVYMETRFVAWFAFGDSEVGLRSSYSFGLCCSC